jgi:membrane protease YdiL (CAAX protease family)
VQAEPGWYADPWQQAPWRWWDGRTWSGHVWPAPPGSGVPWGAPPVRLPAGGVPPWAVQPTTGGPPRPVGSASSFRRAFRPTLLWTLASMLAAVVAGVAVSVPALVVGADDNTALAALTVVAYPVMFGGFYLTARRVSRTHGTGDLRADFGWRTFRASDIGWGLLAGVAALVVQILVGLAFPQPDDSGYSAAVLGEDPNLLVVLAMALPVIIGAPLFEELVFRGPVQRSSIERWGTWPGLLLQGAVFALYHVVGSFSLAQAWYLAPLFAVGVVFGFVKHRTGRLATAQIAHAVMNVLAYLALVASI